MITSRRLYWVVALVAAFLVGFVAYSVYVPERGAAYADDGMHTTVLNVNAGVITASLASPLPMNMRWTINVYATPPGQAEISWGDAVSARVDGETVGVQMTVPTTWFGPTTFLRVVYRCWDPGGNAIWNFTRTVMLP